MSAAALSALPLRPAHPEDGGRGLLLALGAHALLLWALAVGVHWRSSPDSGVAEAELWALLPQAAAPRAAEPPPVQPPPPRPEDRAAERALEREAELAAERDRRRQAELRQRDEEEALRKEARRKAEQREAEQREAERKAERQKAEAQRLQERDRKADEARREKQRQDNLRRLQGLAGAPSGSGAPGSTGTAAQAAGPSAGYAGRIMARIKPNIVFTETLTQRAVAEVLVRCAPDGLILSWRVVKASGNPAWDEAVLKAIEKTARLPRDTDGRVPAEITMVFNSSE